jgi:tricorn protease
MKCYGLLACLVLALVATRALAQDGHALMRYPTVHGQTIVFVARGNLWQVGTGGGVARRLTADTGEDLLPRFSPDGKWIAFTASTQGNEDVYVIPAGGGQARRLTFHSDIVPRAPDRWGPDNMVLTWTPDSRNIVFLTRAVAWNTWYSRPFQVPLAGGLPTPLPLDRAGQMSFSPDGHAIAYNRIFRNFRTWKRYDGGLAQDIFVYDFPTAKLSRVTDWKGTSTAPMWAGRRIYYLSDRGANRRANIWVHDLDSGRDTQVTHFTDYDIDFPSMGGGTIVFQQGGALCTLDTASGQVARLDVTTPDDGTRTQPRFVHADRQLRQSDAADLPDYALSPNGKRAALAARGDLFSVPAEHGPTRNLTETSGADEDHPAWSPDGNLVAYTTDSSGGQQLAIRAATGGPERQVTRVQGAYFYTPVWSPDGKSLSVSDAQHRLWIVPADGGAPVQVARNAYGEMHDQSWSPDGRYLAFSQPRATHLDAIWIYDTASRTSTALSGQMEDDYAPVFSPDGKYLVFLSNRHENPTFSQSEQNVATLKTTGIYIAPLAAATPSPFAVQSDEGAFQPATKDEAADYKPGNTKPIHLETAGLMARAVMLPIEPADITELDMRGGRIFYQTKPLQMIEGELPGEKSALHVYDLAARKDATILQGLDGYRLSADGQKLLVRMDHAFHVIDARPDQKPETGKALKLDGLRTRIDPRQEWAEMFENAWRLERDLFYNPTMNGVNWQGVHDAYAKFLPLLGSRADLTYLIGQVQGELGNSHTYVNDGDEQDATELAPTPLLGADFTVDAASGRTVFARVLPGDNTREAYRSPLTAPGIDVRGGDFLLAVNGHELHAPDTVYSLMAGLQGPVTLTVAPSADGARRQVVVQPIAQELNLRELAWTDHNRALVDRLSGGRIAYVYMSNMESLGMEQFVRQFYPQMDRAALVMDDRWNGGGFIDQIVLERLRRTLVGMSTNREHAPQTIPQQLIDGPKICLINHYSASDGDIFPYYFRKYGLGQLLGTRTWGGVRGIRGPWTLIDGGSITVPEASLYGLDSHWVIENRGVEPDIAMEDDPADIMADRDRQLEAAVTILLYKLKHDPKPRPPAPALLPAYPPAVGGDGHEN